MSIMSWLLSDRPKTRAKRRKAKSGNRRKMPTTFGPAYQKSVRRKWIPELIIADYAEVVKAEMKEGKGVWSFALHDRGPKVWKEITRLLRREPTPKEWRRLLTLAGIL